MHLAKLFWVLAALFEARHRARIELRVSNHASLIPGRETMHFRIGVCLFTSFWTFLCFCARVCLGDGVPGHGA